MTLKLLEVFVLWICVLAPGHGGKNDKIISSSYIESIEGYRASLYCPIQSQARDKINMVLWFRGDVGIPIYSYDVRGNSSILWSAPEVFGTRATYIVDTDPAYLQIKDIKRHDQGIYRCRVDYQNSQTISLKFNLTVIILPEPPIVLDRWGRVINGTTIGPFEQDDSLIITCRTFGGRPPPQVRWLVNGVNIDDQFEKNSGNVIENRLLWPSLQRKDLYSVFTCQALNTIKIEPKERRLVLDMYLKPLFATIINGSIPLVADKKYEIHCQTGGSRPEASITWFKGKKPLKRTKDFSKENVTVSILNFVPSVEDNGKTLLCRAENPNVSGLFLEDSWNMSVLYPPIVSLALGSKLQAIDIKEGDDVYFECKIQSNPQWRKLTWLKNGNQLTANSTTKIVKSNQSLVLQRVTKFSAGKYQCSAFNSEGETLSNEFPLKVKFAPLCSTDKLLVIGASKGESLFITCNINSYPSPKKFYWKFENSEETIDIDKSKFENNGTRSVLNFSTVSEHDYGSISCWAKNEIGTQTQPCIFQLILASPPSAVTNCSYINDTEHSLTVNCNPNYDGGLTQSFTLDIISLKHKMSIFNVTNHFEPNFRIELNRDVLDKLINANENDILRIFVCATNQKGRSLGVFIREVYLGNFRKQPSDLKDSENKGSPILVGLFITILLIGCTLITKLYWKTRKVKRQQFLEEDKYKESRTSLLKQDTFASDAFSSPKFKPSNPGTSHKNSSIKTRGKIETIDDEQDPDLIPQYPRYTNIPREELIPMNSDPSFFDKSSHKSDGYLSDVEINFNVLHGKVINESCV